MSAKVRIPTVLRPLVGGSPEVEVEGATIGEVLGALVTTYPAARGQFLAEDGTLHRFLNVYINDDDVRYIGGIDAKVADGDEITLLPAVAGGAA
jgi:sulfur-carrier protein